jgi:hypothetical protein
MHAHPGERVAGVVPAIASGKEQPDTLKRRVRSRGSLKCADTTSTGWLRTEGDTPKKTVPANLEKKAEESSAKESGMTPSDKRAPVDALNLADMLAKRASESSPRVSRSCRMSSRV